LDDKKTKISKTIFATEVTEATELLRPKKRMESSLYGRGYPPTKACPYRFQLLYLCALCDLGG